MIRAVLSLFLCALTLGAGLATAWIQCANHVLADELDRAKRKEDLVTAEIESLEAGVQSRAYALEREWTDPEPGARVAAADAEVPER